MVEIKLDNGNISTKSVLTAIIAQLSIHTGMYSDTKKSIENICICHLL